MNSRNVWIMLALVALLGGMAFWQLGREKSPQFQLDRPLFDGVQPERVQSIHIDNLERSLQLALERDANGTWQIVDPIAFAAEGGVMDRLLEVVSKNRATRVDKPDLAQLSLSPPRAVLELNEALPGGVRKLRLELGEKDSDGKHVYARVDGEVVRTLLNLDSTLERDLSDWRQRRILNVDPSMVAELRRRGKYALESKGPEVDMSFAAEATPTGWRSSLPWNAALDPAALDALLSNLCYMRVGSFVADSAVEVQSYDMERAELQIGVTLTSGGEEELLLHRHRDSESWLCMRKGSTHLFRVDQLSVVFLSAPSDGFLDARLARVDSDKVQRIEMRDGAKNLTLRRDGQIWMLGASERGIAQREAMADAASVTDLLAALQLAHAARFLIDESAPAFAESEGSGLKLFTSEAEYGCDFGPEREVSAGVPGRLFRRKGDEVVGVVEEKTAALARSSWTAFVDRQMIKLPERGISRIELVHGGVKRVFVRDPESGRWSPQGVDVEAPKAFLKCVERLLSLRADVAVALDASFEFADVWEVSVIDGSNLQTNYRLGSLASDPKQQGFEDGRVRGLVSSSGLFDDLNQIP